VVHLQVVDRGQGQLLQPDDARFGREALGGHLPLQLVPPQDVPGLVDQARPGLAGLLTKRGQPPVLLIAAAGDIDVAQTADRFALQQAVAVDPQQLTERGSVTAVGLAFLALLGLDQDYLVAAVISEHANQPIVEAADFEHGHERLAVAQALAGELLEEGVDLLGLGGHLPGLQDIAAFSRSEIVICRACGSMPRDNIAVVLLLGVG
jgi:hypothetical protein